MLHLYGSRISYYAGKLETYLRYRGIPYELLPFIPHARTIEAGAGAVQSPVVRLEDGRWMSDTTPMLAWLDAQRDASSSPSIYHYDASLRFAALLLEDHADEWLWRPAMHFRWSYQADREYASGVLADEQGVHRPGPRFAKRWIVVRRQLGGFVRREGVDAGTRAHVEATVLAAMDGLEAVLADRPFLLGERPTIADFGFVGPMFRHLSMDPTPAQIMRGRAPRVYTWVARMWEARPQPAEAPLVADVDAPVAALLREACETHLVQLRENARAFAAGARHFEQEVQGCRYRRLPVSRYRVWCLEELLRHWSALDASAQARLRAHLVGPGAGGQRDAEPGARAEEGCERRGPLNREVNGFDGAVPR